MVMGYIYVCVCVKHICVLCVTCICVCVLWVLYVCVCVVGICVCVCGMCVCGGVYGVYVGSVCVLEGCWRRLNGQSGYRL